MKKRSWTGKEKPMIVLEGSREDRLLSESDKLFDKGNPDKEQERLSNSSRKDTSTAHLL